MNAARLTLIVGLALAGGAAQAQDRANLEPAVILGNHELPKVLYIVPWKKPVQGEGTGRQLVSVVNEELAPIDPDVFRRQLQYQAQQQARQADPSAKGASSPP
ncbi:MAG: hypothetical protein ACM3VZ_14570 [Acidobacteriota bacterium]